MLDTELIYSAKEKTKEAAAVRRPPLGNTQRRLLLYNGGSNLYVNDNCDKSDVASNTPLASLSGVDFFVQRRFEHR